MNCIHTHVQALTIMFRGKTIGHELAGAKGNTFYSIREHTLFYKKKIGHELAGVGPLEYSWPIHVYNRHLTLCVCVRV